MQLPLVTEAWPEAEPMQLCGDPTCQSYSCSQEALDAWYERQERAAAEIVQMLLSGEAPAGEVPMGEGC